MTLHDEQQAQEREESLVMENITRGVDVVNVDLWYPRQDPVKAIQIGLVDVRAADDIRIIYDFDRDGWAISQQAFDSEGCAGDWREAAFIQAWQLDESER